VLTGWKGIADSSGGTSAMPRAGLERWGGPDARRPGDTSTFPMPRQDQIAGLQVSVVRF
jgi:hypothetical protein